MSFNKETLNKASKQIANWILLGCILVIAMVVVGGITRLTHSGLSMVTWKPVTGTIPPLNNLEWLAEFDKYKTSPEYIKKNYHFTLEEFKSIFFWEYLHRLLARVIGIVFLIPFIYFVITKKIKSKKMFGILFGMFLLGLMQAVVGWIMVKSGLKDNPNVSHFKLALHFITALVLYSYMIWVWMRLQFKSNELATPHTFKIKKSLLILTCLTFLQIVYGAFVAGLKAGLMYPTYPKMGTEWMPSIMQDNIAEQGLFALINDPYSIQFIHRWLAAIVLIFTFYTVYKMQSVFINRIQTKAKNFILIAIAIQFSLGVLTILYSVPVVLGVLHQLGAVVFLTSILFAFYAFKTTQEDLIC